MTSSPSLLEDLTIQAIPDSRRTGKVRHLFPVWFGVQIMPLTLVTGMLGPTIFGLDLWWTIFAIVLGNVIGAVFMALHSVQGSHLGVPQMIQARAQFGMYGAVLVLVVVILMYLGFLASILVLARDTLLVLIPGLNPLVALIFCAAVTLMIVMFGYDLIHRFNRILLPLFVIAVVLLAVFSFMNAGAIPEASVDLGFNLTGFMSMAAIAATWQIAYAPYVSDYSRYLPRDTSSASAYWYTYLGSIGGAIPVMSLGALVVLASNGAGAMSDMATVLPVPVTIFVIIMLFCGAMDACVINLYGPALTALTFIQTFRRDWSPGARARNVTATIFVIIATLVAAVFADNFLSAYSAFIHVLMTFLIPWSIVNLVDYYIIKKGDYDVAAFNDPNSGYGKFNVPALTTYVIGFLIQVPFISQGDFFTGPLAESLGGADLSWLVGTIASFVIYLVLVKWWNKSPQSQLPDQKQPVPSEKASL